MAFDPQVPWTDEQWGRVNQVIQEEAKRARVAATFLPLYGPLSADADYVRRQGISYDSPAASADAARNEINAAGATYRAARDAAAPDYLVAAAALQRIAAAQDIVGRNQLNIGDRDTMRLATLQVMVRVRNAQMVDPELSSALALFRRAANVLARLEDAIVFRGLAPDPVNPGGFAPPGRLVGLPRICQITGAEEANGLWAPGDRLLREVLPGPADQGPQIVAAVSGAIGDLEQNGHFGPFAVVLGQGLFLVAQTPDPGSLVLPQDRIIPFLGGGPLLRSSTLDEFAGNSGIVVALGGAPVELVVATDVCLQFLQVTNEPIFLFRVCEKIALRIREPDAIVRLFVQPP
jgi:uncharacterized linocin/CFP29 family protein